MKFVFVFAGPNKIGGIETLIARMSRWLVDDGHAVALLTNTFSECSSLLPRTVRVVELGRDYERLYRRRSARAVWTTTGLDVPDVIKSFDMASAWAASVLGRVVTPEPRVLCGIYNPVFLKGPDFSVRNLRSQVWEAHLVNHVRATSRIFMAGEQMQSLKALYGSQQSGRLLPLPLDISRWLESSRSPKRGKVVSVGRLVAWKGYNLYMIRVIRELRERGHDVEWDVYGDGDESYVSQMRSAIASNDLSKHVRLCGSLNYERFGEAMRDAWVFVGMGTSVLEAAACGVPNVVALAADHEAVTLGPIYEFPLGNTGEPGTQGSRTPVVRELERILSMSSEKYLEESRRVREYVSQYGQERVMRTFLAYSAEASVSHVSRFLRILYFFSFIWIGIRRAAGVSVPG